MDPVAQMALLFLLPVCEADHSPPFSAMSIMLAAITQLPDTSSNYEA
jgi:hypothetical protein